MRHYARRKGGRRWAITPERWREILDDRVAASMARPAPIYIADVPAGTRVGRITIEMHGKWVEIIDLYQPAARPGGVRPRCDSFDGRCGADAELGGWTAIFRAAVARWIPRAMSRRAVATLDR